MKIFKIPLGPPLEKGEEGIVPIGKRDECFVPFEKREAGLYLSPPFLKGGRGDFLPAPHSRRRSPPGFTLIELMAVMMIVTIAVALVAPDMFRAYEKIQVQSEIRVLMNLFRTTGISAFLSQTEHSITCVDRKVTVAPSNDSFDFKHIVFPEKIEIRFSEKGFANVEKLRIAVGGKAQIVSLSAR